MNAASVSPNAYTAHVYRGPQLAAAAPAVTRTDIVFVADNLTDWATLARGVPEGMQVVVLDSRGNGLQQMADWLATQPEGSVDAVHLLSHGAAGQVQLGSLVLTADNLHTQANALAQIQRSLTEDGDWLLYGCDVAAGAQGVALVQGLALFSRADIAASIDRTGSAALGGNWTLEATRGSVDALSVQLRDSLTHYQNSLSTQVAFTGDTGNTNSPVATFASGTPQSSIAITATGDVLNVAMSGTNMFHDTVANFAALGMTLPTDSSGMVFVSQNDNFVNSITLSVQAGKVFDFVSMLLMEANDEADTFTFTPNGNAAKKVTLSFAANETKSVDLSANTDFDNLSTLTISTADGNFQARFDNIVLENIRSPNAAPTLGGITASTTINDTATATPFSTVTVGDADADNVTVSVTLDAAAKGVFTPTSLTDSGFTSSGGGVYNLASTTAALAQAAIRQLVFDPTDNRVAAASTEATTFTISVNDGVNTAVTNSTTTVTATSVNDAPTLTAVSTLTGASEDTALAITYATLAAAADEADVDPGSTLSFRVEAVSAGNLYTNSELTTPVTPGTTLLSSGGTWYWKPAADTNGTGGSALSAFTVKAWDGTAASATAIQVKVDVTALNDAPTRTAGSLAAVSVLEDAANGTAASLGVGAVAYGNGGGSDESGQTLAYTVTAIPSFISLFKADGTTAVTASSTLTAAELQGLTYKTVANGSGTGNLTWTVVDSGGTSNGGQNTLTESLAVTVTGVNDAPTRTAGSLTALTVNENSANTTATTLGLSAVTYGNGGGSDESGQALTYTITAVPAFISLFKADGSTAVTASSTLTAAELQGLTYKTVANEAGTGSITWTVTDNGGTANSGANTLTESLTFTVNGVPFFSSGSTGSIAENATITTAAYWAATFDAENDVMTYSLGGTDASDFDIHSTTGKVTLKASADYEAKSSYSIQVNASDGMANVSKAITVNVTNVNEAPTNVALSASTVAENTSTASALTVGALSSTDPDAGSTFTYSIVSGADQASFQISGANLQFKTGSTLNYEAQSSYAVTVRATDQGGLTYDKAFTINLTDVNEAPTVANTIGNQSAHATQAFSYQFASNTFADVDAGQTLTYTATKGDGSALPTWLSFDGSSRTFSGIPASGDAGSFTVKVTATDNGTGSLNTFTTFDINVAAGPTVSGIVRAGAASANVQGSATSVDYTVTFSESVTGVTSDDFNVTGTGGASGNVSGVTGSGTTWTVTVNTLTGDGTLRLDLNGSGTGIQNGSAAAIVGGYTSGQTYTLDHTPPTLAIGTVATDDRINDTEDESSVTVSGTSSGADGQTVSVNVGGTTKTDTIATGGAWSVSLSSAEVKALSEGNVSVTADVSDAVGNAATQASQTVVYDRTAPTLAIGTVASDDKINDTEDDSSVTVSGTSSGADGQTVSVNVGGTAKTATIASGGAWSFLLTSGEVKALTPGNVSITANVNDAAGNAAMQATSTVVYDRTAPTVTSMARQTPASSPTNADTLVYRVTFAEAISNLDAADLHVAGTTASVSNVASAGGNAYDITLSGGDLANLTGNVTLSFAGGQNITDAAGNALTATTPTGTHNPTYALDNAAPTLAISTVAGDDRINATEDDSAVAIAGTTTAEDGQIVTVHVGALTKTATAASGAWSVSLSSGEVQGLTAGNVSITADVSDVVGNAATQATKTVVYDTTAPVFAPATSTPADNATTFGIGSDIVVKFGERIDASSDLTKVYLKDVDTDTLVPATFTLDADGNIVINPTASLSHSKAYYVTWDANALKDAAGNIVAAVADETTYNFTTEAEPPAPAPAPAPVPTTPTVTTTVDGTTVQTQTNTQTGSDGRTTTTTTQTVAPVTPTRPEDPNTPNSTLADIPLARDSAGTPTIQVSLPVGVGLVSESTSTGTGTGGTSGTLLTLREKLIAASDPRVDGDGPMQEIIANGIDQYVPSVTDQGQVTVRTITLTVAPPAGGGAPTPPAQPIVIRGASGTGEDDATNPQRGEALVIDARNLPPGTVLDLSLVEFAIIIGPTTATGGTGRNYVIGDGSQQFIVLGPEDDVIHGGAGDDTVGSKGGDDQIFGDEGNDSVVGGIGNDTLQGGDGNDILQGGASDAGTWNFKLNAQGQLQASFAPTSTELADSTGFSATGNWSAAAGANGTGPITDSRFAWIYDDYAVAQDAALLVHALANRLPTLYEMGGVADGTYSSEQLAYMAHDYFARTGTPGGKAAFEAQSLSAQVSTVINQVWGANSVTTERVNLGVNHLSGGGSWTNVWLALARYSTNASKITDAQGNVSLINNQALSDTGWSANSGNDKLLGGAGNDVLIGGHGNDEIDGGSGTDMAVYLGALADYEVAITPSTAQGVPAGTHDALIRHKLTGEVDTVRGVELFKIGHTVYAVPPGQPQPADNVFVELGGYVLPVVEAQLVGLGFDLG